MLEVIEHGEIREIRLARPPVNALNAELLRALVQAVTAAANRGALFFSGKPGLFSAGLDVPGILELDRDGMVEVFASLWRAQQALAVCPVPVVFAITGHCPAGGTVLALHGDYRVMAEGSFKIGLNETQVGLFPGEVIHGAFRRLVGGHAAQLLTRGALVDPPTALRLGLVDELCAASDCVPRALQVAQELCALPRETMLQTRVMARRDLQALFGPPDQAEQRAREFGEAGAAMFSVPDTRARLERMFRK